MKNLRKIFAVVLVVCMALSFAAVASAKYTDDSSIKYSTAVGVMTGIGAINGKPGGAFDPTGSITRAEAAKLITYAILGPTVAKALPSVTSSFSDVPASHWAAPYISYLVAKGIINGRGDGTFNPNGNVTAVEMAKMLLASAGYGKNNEFTGPSWSINVVSEAFNMNVFAGSAQTDYSKPATREEAALYVFNALMNIEKVTYSKLFDEYTVVTGADKTIAQSVYGMQAPVTGIIVGNATTGLAGTKLAVADVSAAGKLTNLTADATLYKYATALNQVGTVVKAYFKNADTVYYMDTLSKSVTSIFGVSTANGYRQTFGTATAAPEVVNANANYAAVTIDAAIAGGFNGTDTGAAGTYVTFGGNIVSYIANSANTIEKVAAINTTAGSESIELSFSGVLANNATTDIVNAYDGIAKGDTVTVTKAGDVYNIGKTSTVSGKITAWDGVMWQFTMDGKAYGWSFSDTDKTAVGFLVPATSDYGKTNYTLYLDANGSVYGIKAAEAASSSVVYVTGNAYESGSSFGVKSYAVQAVDSTGKEVIYNCGTTNPSVDIVAPAVAPALNGAGFYKVSVNSSTGIATFSAYNVATDLVAPSVDTDNTVTKLDIVNGTDGTNVYYYASDVQFIFVTGAGSTLKVTKVTGVTAAAGNDITDAMLFINNTAGPNKVINTVMVYGTFVNPSSTGLKLLYLPAGTGLPQGSNANGYVYNVYLDGVRTAVTASNNDVSAIDGGFVSYGVDANGVYTFGDTPIAASGTIHYNITLGHNSIYNGYVDARATTGAAVVDLVTNPFGGDPMITSVAAMETLNATKNITISYASDATTGAITQIYITAIS